MWPQGDARDPLGIWGGRRIVTGDASGGGIQVRFAAAATIAGAFIFTCYNAQVSNVDATSIAAVRCRLLTNWPDVDAAVGVQGFATHLVRAQTGSSFFPAPLSGPDDPLVMPSDRFILLFDPRPVAGAFDIVSLAISENTNTVNFAFEAWGYYWDRQVLNTPGGPRHPGSS